MTISTRQLRARPAARAFDVIGSFAPRPDTVTRDAGVPVAISSRATASARSRLSWLLEAAEPTLSVCPTTRTVELGYWSRLSETELRAGRIAGSSSDDPAAKVTD